MRIVIASLIVATSSLTALAAAPEGAKLSQVIAKLEQTPDVHYIDEVDWSDRGYYEVEYVTKNGARVEVKIDPKTGETVK